MANDDYKRRNDEGKPSQVFIKKESTVIKWIRFCFRRKDEICGGLLEMVNASDNKFGKVEFW